MNSEGILKPKLLLVEDNPTNMRILSGILKKLDCDLLTAENGQAALDLIWQHDLALILMDIQLPDMDGFQIAQKLSEDSRKRETPLILLSATFTDDPSRLNAYKLGAVDFMTKPVDPFILKSKVQVFLDLYEAKLTQMQLLKLVHKHNKQLETEIKERELAEERARHQASHDPLTDLPNRILFMDRLETAIERAKRSKGSMGLLYVDLDRFKPVNDNYGHHAGDALLIAIAARLKESLRKTDTIARLGGDEFAVVLEGVSSKAAAQEISDKLLSSLEQPFTIRPTVDSEEVTVELGASMGLAIYPDDAAEEEALLRCADSLMYANKKAHREKNQA